MHLAKTITSISLLVPALVALGTPAQLPFKGHYFDIQGHRGSRGEASENTLLAFAWGMIDGVTTLELDNGITKDGVVVVWHDEELTAEKCQDTAPVIQNDPDFPYVGKHIANLILAQVKTVDCGSKRLAGYPLALTNPGTRISTLSELFAFARCADPGRKILWNIESKINPVSPNSTKGVDNFVEAQHKEFVSSSYPLSQIIYQSFDWRTLIAMKALDPRIPVSALIEHRTTTSEWLAGLELAGFPGETPGIQIVNAAKSIGADTVSPAAVSSASMGVDPSDASYIPFTTQEMIARAHSLGMEVKPWRVDRMNIVEQLLDWGVDGIITDYPAQMRRIVQQKGYAVAPKFPKKRVLECLNKYL